MAFIIGLPVIQIVLFCISIGKDPIGLKIAIVNNELKNSTDICVPTISCDTSQLSCRFLDHLKNKSLVFLPYETEEEAEYAVQRGWAWGAISFPANYSEALIARIKDGKDVHDWDLVYSAMDIVMDMSSNFHMLITLYLSSKS